MAKVLVSESHLINIANAIRTKNGGNNSYTPAEMASAISAISAGYPEPTGTKNIISNGSNIDVKDYASANVNVPNSYSSGDEGKVVSNGQLVAQTSTSISSNGTYNTTLNNEVVVNISGGGSSSYPVIDAIYNEQLSGIELQMAHEYTAPVPASSAIEQAYNDYFTYLLASDYKRISSGDKKAVELTENISKMSVADFVNVDWFGAYATEYAGYIYESALINALGLVLLGDFSQGGNASNNALSDSINNYSGVILQGIYNKSRTSGYNTSCLYQNVALDTEYWAGMKDRNPNYDCKITFTDDQTVSLTGNKQVIIYGIL